MFCLLIFFASVQKLILDSMFLEVQPHQSPIVLSNEVIKIDANREGREISLHHQQLGTHWVSLSFSEEEQNSDPATTFHDWKLREHNHLGMEIEKNIAPALLLR